MLETVEFLLEVDGVVVVDVEEPRPQGVRQAMAW
jgi:hypothetical protein